MCDCKRGGRDHKGLKGVRLAYALSTCDGSAELRLKGIPRHNYATGLFIVQSGHVKKKKCTAIRECFVELIVI